MNKLILSRPAADAFQKISDYTNDSISIFGAHSVSLSGKDKIGLRTMGKGREGVVLQMSTIALSFEECLPRTENASDLETILEYHKDLLALHTRVGKLYEMLGDTISATCVDAIQTFDDYNNHFQTARKKNSSLDLALKPIDEYNKRFGKLGEETVDPDGEEGDTQKPDQPKA